MNLFSIRYNASKILLFFCDFIEEEGKKWCERDWYLVKYAKKGLRVQWYNLFLDWIFF